MSSILEFAPELAVSEWFNTAAPLTLAALRGRVVFLHAFQVLCPGCVAAAIPQVQRIERTFAGTDLQVIGLHTVFEHHAAMPPLTLKAFLREYRLTSPVGVDAADGTSAIPVTMRRFAWRGTPSSVLIGRDGRILHRTFGVDEDIVVGARIASALSTNAPDLGHPAADASGRCVDGRCAVRDSVPP